MRLPVPAILCLGVAVLAAPAPAQQADGYWEYRDWAAATTTINTGDSDRRRCVVLQQATGEVEVRIEILTGRAPPPEAFPAVTVRETAPRGEITALQNGDMVRVQIGDTASRDHAVRSGTDEDGIHRAGAVVPGSEAQPILRAMAAGAQLRVLSGGQVMTTRSLTGFSDAYAKAMSECGYSGAGVLN